MRPPSGGGAHCGWRGAAPRGSGESRCGRSTHLASAVRTLGSIRDPVFPATMVRMPATSTISISTQNDISTARACAQRAGRRHAPWAWALRMRRAAACPPGGSAALTKSRRPGRLSLSASARVGQLPGAAGACLGFAGDLAAQDHVWWLPVRLCLPATCTSLSILRDAACASGSARERGGDERRKLRGCGQRAGQRRAAGRRSRSLQAGRRRPALACVAVHSLLWV